MRKTVALIVSLLALVACPQAKLEPPKINHFTASPNSLPSGGGSVTLDWDVSGATAVSLDQGVGALSPTDKGTKAVNVSSNQTFTLSATNPSGTVTSQLSVTVAVSPSISLSPTSRAFVAGSPGGVFDANVQGSSGTVNWVLSGPGNLSSATGPSVIYTPPATVPSLTSVTLMVSVTGTTLSATATISLAPEVLTGGVLFYQSDGSGQLETLGAGGAFTPVKTFNAAELPANATHFGKPYDLYELFYSASDGSGALGSFDGAGNFRKLRSYAPGDLPTGQTHMLSLSDRLVFYAAGTSICGFYSSPNYDYTIQKTTRGFTPNYNIIVFAGTGVLFYRNDSIGAFGSFDANCKWTQVASYNSFSPNWSNIIQTAKGTFFYRKTDGVGAVVSFAANGGGVQTGTFYAGTLKKDWEQVIDTKSGVLFYKADGSGELGTIDANTYTVLKSYAAGELPANASLVTSVGN